ncbi:hypothetical protein CBOM_05677 [Ceraceosorus bombacis]|uniref:Uncharacterized protein n=1 Tax=Ceraceosorus bombacis TaxID=401625 RepID=A0A0P1BQ07_9BASI|nr:hypothetical protein CBOM_05677 [Ceraceosorus bombacis]
MTDDSLLVSPRLLRRAALPKRAIGPVLVLARRLSLPLALLSAAHTHSSSSQPRTGETLASLLQRATGNVQLRRIGSASAGITPSFPIVAVFRLWQTT